MDRGTSFSKYPYIINEFGNVWENRFDQTTLPFNCSVDRGSNPRDRLGLINHFFNDEVVRVGIQYSNKDLLNQVNAAMGDAGVLSGFKNCTEQHGARPTFMLVNFSDRPETNGAVMAGDVLNNVTSAAGLAAASTSTASRVEVENARILIAALALAVTILVM